MASGAQAPTGTITGRVVDSTSQLPIANVTVVAASTNFVFSRIRLLSPYNIG